MPAPSDERPPRTIDGIKKEAKDWLALLRLGDTAARTRFEHANPHAPREPVLRDVQHAIALERGFNGWAALKAQLEATGDYDPDRVNRADWLLEHACIDPILTNGLSAQLSHLASAMRILKRHPEVARENIHTACVCGDARRVDNILAADPEAALRIGGPIRFRYIQARESRWTPLLHLCYGRLPIAAANDNAVAIARMLLDHGADPNAYFEVGSHPSRYTCLTGLAGGGEESTPPHPQADALIALLLERGANPIDIQFFYNSSQSGEAFRWFDMLYERSVKLGRESEWTEPRWNPARSLSALDWLYLQARELNDPVRAQWLLAHGATPHAFPEPTPERNVEEPFTSYCFALDRARAIELLAQHPEFLRSHRTLFAAASANRPDVVAFVLDLGIPIDVEDQSKQQALHVAASNNAFAAVELLVARGANLEAEEKNWNNTPLDHAIYGNQTRMIELLSSYSNNVSQVVWTGNLTRLRDLLRDKPELAKVREEHSTPLMWLPNDDVMATEAAALLLAHGADATVVNEKGQTAAYLAAKRGLDEAAALLRRAETQVQ